MLLLYLLLLGVLAWFTAYTRNFQRTVVMLGSKVDAAAAARLMPQDQRLRTMAMLAGWPVALGAGLMFIAWWKVVALVVGAFLILVPVLGSLTPRSMSRHYVDRVRADLEHRISRGERHPEELRRILRHLDRLEAGPP